MTATVLERLAATTGRIKRPESDGYPAHFTETIGKDHRESDLAELTRRRQVKLDAIAAADALRKSPERQALVAKVAEMQGHVVEQKLALAAAEAALNQAVARRNDFDHGEHGIETIIESNRSTLKKSADPAIQPFVKWCNDEMKRTQEKANPRRTIEGEPRYNLDSGWSTPVSIDYNKFNQRQEALREAKAEAEKLYQSPKAIVADELEALRATIPPL